MVRGNILGGYVAHATCNALTLHVRDITEGFIDYTSAVHCYPATDQPFLLVERTKTNLKIFSDMLVSAENQVDRHLALISLGRFYMYF